MSKYIKLEDAIEQVKTEFYGGGYQEWLEISIDNLINRIANLPTIEMPTELNGVILKDCDKVIEPFLEEHECDELWHTVRALRDFYDWVTEEERRDNE